MNRVIPRDARINPRRTIEFDEPANAYIIRDRQSILHAVLHTQKPVLITAATALQAAKSYVQAHAELLGLDPSQLMHLDLPIDPSDTGIDYRFAGEKRQFDVTTVTFQQTCLGWPVWRAAVSVHVKHLSNSFKVISAQIRRHDNLTHRRLDDMERQVIPVDKSTLARQLGIAENVSRFDAASLRIAHQNPMVYRYEAKQRVQTPNSVLAKPLPPVSNDIADGSFNTVSAVYFDLPRRDRVSTHWLALVDARTQSVLYLEEFANDANGMVFRADPVTTHGGPMPSAIEGELSPLRVWRVLANLLESDPQLLCGTNVKIEDIDGPVRLCPTKPSGVDFAFPVRTDEFAAVNAYYNCDRFFSLVESLGFRRDDYFPCTTFPIAVDHRGAPAQGVASNDAQTRGRSIPQPNGSTIKLGIVNVVFALAQPDRLILPIGNANDWRVVLHELGGHGTLLNHVGSTKFLFAHSVGDSLAAILNDPESNAEDKDETFAWLGYDRWHNRSVEDGWGWDGPKDLSDGDKQLHREQILSTTHFNFYKAIGGSNTNQVDTRHYAARFTTYLMLRAIQTLTHPLNPQHASDWLTSLIVADDCDWTSEGHSGGAYEKVICWAFLKQGLFNRAALDVDVYIDDGRDGDYEYRSDYSSCAAIWNRLAADGLEGHQAPVANVPNFAYVKIKNRGSKIAQSVVVNAFQNMPQSDLIYPDDWQPMAPAQLPAIDLPSNSSEVTVGPFTWTPCTGDNYILMAVSASGDASNLGKFGDGKSVPDWRLVPYDNNLGMRKA